MVNRRLGFSIAVLALALCGSAPLDISAAHHAPAQLKVEADASLAIPPALRNVALRWMRMPPRKIAEKVATSAIKRAGRKWLASGGTVCVFPFPQVFCIAQERVWGLGQAVSYNGLRPGVWNRTYSRQYEVTQPLVPGSVYHLTCWLLGDRVEGPFGSTDLWYRVVSGGYVSDALLYTGTNDVIRGVAHC